MASVVVRCAPLRGRMSYVALRQDREFAPFRVEPYRAFVLVP